MASKPIEFPRIQGTEVELVSFSAIAVILCKCGVKKPITIFFIPSLPLSGFCPECQTKFFIGRIQWDMSQMQQPMVGIGWQDPEILIPKGQIQ